MEIAVINKIKKAFPKVGEIKSLVFITDNTFFKEKKELLEKSVLKSEGPEKTIAINPHSPTYKKLLREAQQEFSLF